MSRVPRVDDVPARPRPLAREHRGVRVVDEGGRVARIGGLQADPDARRDVDLRAVDHERLSQGLEGLGGDRRGDQWRGAHAGPDGDGGISNPERMEPAEENQELVAAQAGHQVQVASHGPQPGGHQSQQLVPGRMAEAVVDQLEVVEVHVHHRDLRGRPFGPAEGEPQELLEHDPSRKAGEPVVVHEEGDLLLCPAALGDVSPDALHAHRNPVLLDEPGVDL